MKRILKFGAEWCNSCKQLSKTLQELNIDYEEIDVENNDDLVEAYHIQSLPTLLILEDDKELTRLIGNVPKSALINII